MMRDTEAGKVYVLLERGPWREYDVGSLSPPEMVVQNLEAKQPPSSRASVIQVLRIMAERFGARATPLDKEPRDVAYPVRLHTLQISVPEKFHIIPVMNWLRSAEGVKRVIFLSNSLDRIPGLSDNKVKVRKTV